MTNHRQIAVLMISILHIIRAHYSTVQGVHDFSAGLRYRQNKHFTGLDKIYWKTRWGVVNINNM